MAKYVRQIQWDTEYSTYRWKIFLTNGKSFPGYSKEKGKREIADKVKLLCRIMNRLRKRPDKYPEMIYGYWTPENVIAIELYKRTAISMYEEQLMTLSPTHYTFKSNERFNSNPDIINFFKELYEDLQTGRIIESETSRKQLYTGIGYSKKIDERRFFSLDSFRFKEITSLDKFIAEGITIGYPFEAMNHFRSQYIDKNFR